MQLQFPPDTTGMHKHASAFQVLRKIEIVLYYLSGCFPVYNEIIRLYAQTQSKSLH